MQYQETTGVSPASEAAAERPKAKARSKRFSSGKLKKWLRRAHMYAGLVLLPWLLFFGLSGMLFNHPNIGADVQGERVTPAELAKLGGLAPWDAQQAAGRVLQGLNAASADGSGGPYTLDADFEPSFAGFTVLTAPAPEGRYMLLLDMQRAGGVLVTRKAPPTDANASFPPAQVSLPEFSTPHVEQQVKGLLAARDKPVIAELSAHPQIAPELRFRARDAGGTPWNLEYNTRTGEVSGRRTEAFPSIGFAELMGKMHTTHHFTLGVGALWFWALFEDLLGLAMVFWAVSGLVMWWQIKATRIAGAISFAVALLVAGVVMGGTLNHLTFGDEKAAMGPGE